MPTAFPLDSYNLSDRTRFRDSHTVARRLMDDGEMHVRILGASTFRIIRCVFEHETEAQGQALIDYLYTNRTTEFTMTFNFSSPQVTYQGYIWSEPTDGVTNGTLHTVSFDFRGKVV